jgi:hypothetical protein
MYFVIVIGSRRPGHPTHFDQTEPNPIVNSSSSAYAEIGIRG